MRIDRILADIAQQLAGRLLRKLVLAIAIGVFALAGLYNVTVAGRLALEVEYGAVYAYLIVACIYAVLVVAGIIWWVVQDRAVPEEATTAEETPRMQMATLLDAAMVGYSLAGGEKTRPKKA